jgi:DNA-directed RNA polymerase I, II, and III subunit RPABC1
MVSTDEEVTKLYKIRRTILQMLRDRNYIVSDKELSMSRKDFVTEFGENFKREQLCIEKTHKDNPVDRIAVYFSDDAKLGINVVRTIFGRLSTENITRGILVCQNQLSPSARKGVTEGSSFTKARLEVFLVISFFISLYVWFCIDENRV